MWGGMRLRKFSKYARLIGSWIYELKVFEVTVIPVAMHSDCQKRLILWDGFPAT